MRNLLKKLMLTTILLFRLCNADKCDEIQWPSEKQYYIEPTQETFSPLRPLPKYSGVGPTNQYNDKYDN